MKGLFLSIFCLFVINSIQAQTTVMISAGTDVQTGAVLNVQNGYIVNDGVLVNNINGLETSASVTSGTGPSYTSLLSLNISGTEMNYQWQSSADSTTWSNISGATGAAYTATVTANTYYRAELTTANTSYHQFTPGVKLTLNTTTDKASTVVNGMNDLFVFPNPVKTEFTVSGALSSISDRILTIDMVNVTGEMVYSSKVATHNGILNKKIPLNTTISNGMYLLSVHGDDVNKVIRVLVAQ